MSEGTPKNVVTLEQLEAALALYERRGAGEVAAGRIADDLRTFIRNHTEEKNQALSGKLVQEISLVAERAALEAINASQNVAAKVTAELHKTFDTQIRNLRESLFVEFSTSIRNKVDEAQNTLLVKINSVAATSENSIQTKHAEAWNELKTNQRNFGHEILMQTKDIAHKGVKETEESISRSVSDLVSLHTQTVTGIFQDFKLYLMDQLNQKLVDKQAIEAKMKEIEAGLLAKTNQIINFNVSQARAQMEASAKEEVKEGIKIASAQIFSSL